MKRIYYHTLIPVLMAVLLFSCKTRPEITTPSNEIPGSIARPESPASQGDKGQKLRDAAFAGNEEEVGKLLKAKTPVNSTDEDGRTALMLAAYNGYTGVVRLLLAAGSKVDLQDGKGRTALMYASTGAFPETVSLLLNQGADPNLIDTEDHFTALMFGAAEGQVEVVRILLQFHADPSMVDVDGDRAITFATNNKHTGVVDILKKESGK